MWRSFDRQVEVPPPDAAARAAFFAATVQRPEIASHLRCVEQRSEWTDHSLLPPPIVLLLVLLRGFLAAGGQCYTQPRLAAGIKVVG